MFFLLFYYAWKGNSIRKPTFFRFFREKLFTKPRKGYIMNIALIK